jgi:hypothetical protein
MNRTLPREIAEIEAQIRAGHPDLQRLLRGLADWSGELRILQDEQRRREQAQRRERGRIGGIQDLSE